MQQKFRFISKKYFKTLTKKICRIQKRVVL